MADVSFNEEPQTLSTSSVKRSFFITLAYATGIPKNDTQAQQVLLGIGILLLVGATIPFFVGNKESTVAPEVMDAVMPARVR